MLNKWRQKCRLCGGISEFKASENIQSLTPNPNNGKDKPELGRGCLIVKFIIFSRIEIVIKIGKFRFF